MDAKKQTLDGSSVSRRESFQLPTDPFFAEQVRDVVGLYTASPERAIAPSTDETNPVQARDRTQPARPVSVGRCCSRHRHQEFVAFLDRVDAAVIREPG